jgi:hypothetical protein
VSFVKDDYGHTRGVGAIASMDAASPARRRAAARAAVEMARRDAVMARHTLGRLTLPLFHSQRPAPRLVKAPIPAAWFQPNLAPAPTRLPIRPGLDFSATTVQNLQIKSPGSVLPPKTTAPTLPVDLLTKAVVTSTNKAPTTIVAGGSSTWTAGKAAPAAANVGPIEPLPEMPPDEPPLPALDPAAAPPPRKTSGNLLLYAALGVGALWFLTRSK